MDIGINSSVNNYRRFGKAARTQLSKYNYIKLCYKRTAILYGTHKEFNNRVDIRSQSGIDTQSLLVGFQLPSLHIKLATDELSGKVKCFMQETVHVLKE